MAFNKVEICGVNTSKLPILSAKEKAELFEEIKKGNEEAKKKYIYGNLRLVLSVIQRFSNRGEVMDDLFQVGCIGLIKAINNFDTEQNVQFSTYAVPMIIPCRRYKGEINMTRKQAILQAIKYLNTIEGIDNEIITCLTDISNELPLTKWTKSRVLDTIDEFFLKYGWLPVASDFKSCKEHLPSITVINYLFGTKSIERLYSQYFIDDKYKKCNSFSPYRGNSKTFFINIFTENYRYIQKKLNCSYVTVNMYTNNRKENTPTIITIKKALNCSTYKELLNKCNIRFEENIKKSPSIQLSNITIVEMVKNDILEDLIKSCYKQ